MASSYKPEGYHSVTPYLVTEKADEVIAFIKKVFDAKPKGEAMMTPEGKIGHAEFYIGDSIVMISNSSDMHKAMPSMLYLYIPDVDSTYKKAIAAGATSMREPEDAFYGDRTAGLMDVAGNQWWLGAHQQDIPEEELKRRAELEMTQK